MGLKGRPAKFILHITNLVYFCAGLAVLVVGALGLSDASTIVDLLTFVPKIDELSKVLDLVGLAVGPAIYLTVMGSVVIVLCFIGCGGVFKMKTIMIYIFAVTTLLMMLFNIALIMFYAIDPYFIENQVQSNMESKLVNNFDSVKFNSTGSLVYPDDESAAAWNMMQIQQGCCGVYGYKDYSTFTWNGSFVDSSGPMTAVVPLSCCLLADPGKMPETQNDFVNIETCLKNTSSSAYLNARGCSDYVMQQVTRYNFIYTVTAAGFTGLQALILCLTLRLLMVNERENSV